jgi:hypothetical protein
MAEMAEAVKSCLTMDVKESYTELDDETAR